MRISWLATATNALTLPSRSASSAGERVEIGVGERAERHGQHVELARLDERQQQRRAGPSNVGDLDLGRRLGPATGAERDRGRDRRPSRPWVQRHQLASSASRSRSPATGSTGSSWWRISSTVRAEQPAAARQRGRGLGVVAQPLERGAPNPGSDAAERARSTSP